MSFFSVVRDITKGFWTKGSPFILTLGNFQVALEQPVWASLGRWMDAKRETEEAGDGCQHCIWPVQGNVFWGGCLLCLPLGLWTCWPWWLWPWWPWFCRWTEQWTSIISLRSSSFPGAILIKNAGGGDSNKIKGCWESIHVVEVQEKGSGRSAHYKLTSIIRLWLQTNTARSGTMDLGGSFTREV